MLCLTKRDIQQVFTMKEAIEACKQAFRIYSQGQSVVPLRVNINIPAYEGQTLFMPGYVEELNRSGVKIVSVFPKNIDIGRSSVPATMVLVDGTTGEVCALLDGTYLTQLRTGAAAGAATDLLARPDAKRGALFGTGGQAATQLEALLVARNLRQVKVFDLDKQRAGAFVQMMQAELAAYGAEIVVAESPADAVQDADIITTVTTAKRPVFDGALVKDGAHINAVGAYTPEMQELDGKLVARADKIYVDSREATLAEAGDLIKPIREGLFDAAKLTGELGEAIIGSIPVRQSSREITLFKTVGVAVQDVVTGHFIYAKAVAAGVGAKIDL